MKLGSHPFVHAAGLPSGGHEVVPVQAVVEAQRMKFNTLGAISLLDFIKEQAKWMEAVTNEDLLK